MATSENATCEVSEHGFSDLLIESVYVLILIFTVSGWTVAGFLVWVPLLTRTTIFLASVVFYATLFRDQARVVRAEESLHFAVRFYLRGFEHFIKFIGSAMLFSRQLAYLSRFQKCDGKKCSFNVFGL